MANNIEDLESLPDITVLEDDGITLENIMDEMIQDFQDAYYGKTGEEYILYPANERRIELQVIAGQIYQAYEYGEYLFKQNFIKYMEDDVLKNWGATLGFSETNAKAATVILEFGVDEALDYSVFIPSGTRATAGDGIFFATDEDTTIRAGDTSVQIKATCTDIGTVGNDYAAGQISTIADPVINVSSVSNVTTSIGGQDEYSGDSLREKVFLFPSTYSTAGPSDAYIYWVKTFSEDIIDVKCVTDKNACVNIYVMFKNGRVPDEGSLECILNYIKELNKFPDTDKVSVKAPEVVNYELNATYYISESNKENEESIKESVKEAAEGFVEHQYEGLGVDINPDIFTEYVRVAGAKRVAIESPGFKQINDSQIAICSGINIKYGGLEGE